MRGGPKRDYRQMEISYGAFQRELLLPAEVNPDGISTVYKDGMLQISLPKASPAGSQQAEDTGLNPAILKRTPQGPQTGLSAAFLNGAHLHGACGNTETDEERSRRRTSVQPAIPEVLPLIPGGSTVMYPQQLLPLLATDEHDIKAVGEAAGSDAKMVGVFTQHVLTDEQYEGDMYQLGTAATIVRMATAPDGAVHAILQGVGRIRLLGVEQSQPWILGRIERLSETVERSCGPGGTDNERAGRVRARGEPLGDAAAGAGHRGQQSRRPIRAGRLHRGQPAHQDRGAVRNP